MELDEIINARIANTTLGIEDHGVMTFWLHLEWPGAGQGLGGYMLDHTDSENHDERIGHGHGIIAMRKILETVGVDSWEQLKGKLVRIKKNHRYDDPPILGNILDDKWFDLRGFMRSRRD